MSSDVPKQRLNDDPPLVRHAKAALSEPVEIILHVGRNTFFLDT
jgi:hypothetical protein